MRTRQSMPYRLEPAAAGIPGTDRVGQYTRQAPYHSCCKGLQRNTTATSCRKGSRYFSWLQQEAAPGPGAHQQRILLILRRFNPGGTLPIQGGPGSTSARILLPGNG